LGATSIAMRNALAHTNRGSVADCEIHAIDNAPAMIDASRTLIALGEESLPADRRVPIHLHEADLEAHPLDQASVVAMNFTLQFVKPASRADLMQKIAHALQPGGVLILSEKVRFEDPIVNEMHIDMYHAFKSQNGYSDLEISQKRTALENVLVPDTLDEHRNRLMDAGFSHCTVWFQCFNFASLIAIK
jgi:tRNA (cmo5U34)-methyltransferase